MENNIYYIHFDNDRTINSFFICRQINSNKMIDIYVLKCHISRVPTFIGFYEKHLNIKELPFWDVKVSNSKIIEILFDRI